MANYLPMVLGESANQWLLRLREVSIHSWPQLRQMFIDNYKPTCEQPGTKYELAQIHDSLTELLRHYIRCFSVVWITIRDISVPEAISIFIAGFREPRNADLRKDLLRNQPQMMEELFKIAQDWARIDDALLQYDDDDRAPYRRGPRRDDDRDRDRGYGDRRGGPRDDHRNDRRDDRGNDRRDDRGNNRRDDDRPYKRRGGQDNNNGERCNRGNRNNNSVNNANKGQKREVDEEYEKILSGDCPRHPNKGHTFGECNGFASIFAKKRQRVNRKGNAKKPDARDKSEDDEELEKDPRHAYKAPEKHVTAMIFGSKVGLDNGPDKKLLKRRIFALSKADGLIVDVKAPAWSEQPISFSRADMWAKLPDAG